MNSRVQSKNRSFAIFKGFEIFFLVGAFLSFLFSVTLWFSGHKDQGLFVGIWVPSIIGLSVFFQNVFKREVMQ